MTEDDAQDGRDHVDAHRSLLLAISPYARPGVSHIHTSMASILKTIDLILGMPFLNQYDAAATDLSDMFQNTPDFSAYDGAAFRSAHLRSRKSQRARPNRQARRTPR